MQFKNVDEILNKYGKYVVQQSKSNLTKDKKGGGSIGIMVHLQTMQL